MKDNIQINKYLEKAEKAFERKPKHKIYFGWHRQ